MQACVLPGAVLPGAHPGVCLGRGGSAPVPALLQNLGHQGTAPHL
jgi:hypothetical protein